MCVEIWTMVGKDLQFLHKTQDLLEQLIWVDKTLLWIFMWVKLVFNFEYIFLNDYLILRQQHLMEESWDSSYANWTVLLTWQHKSALIRICLRFHQFLTSWIIRTIWAPTRKYFTATAINSIHQTLCLYFLLGLWLLTNTQLQIR